MDTTDSEVTRKKRLLINEMRRTAEANHGIPLGQINFSKATGIKISDWRGKLWLRWSDVQRAAGFEPNKKAHAYPEKFLLDSFIALMRELGHFPIATELQQKGYHNPAFPSHMAFKSRWGNKVQQAEQIAQYCRRQEDYGDILAMCEEVLTSERLPARAPVQAKGMVGYVYLVKKKRTWGTYYKLHWSLMRQQNSRYIGTRNGQPYLKNGAVHLIRTDDPEGICAYWRQRFTATCLRRREGECYLLTRTDIQAFKSRSVM
jgi:hypothetical protein